MSSQRKNPVIESDWKKFSAMIPMLRERYLAEQNARIARMLAHPKKNETERFWDAADAMRKESGTLRMCLDNLSRSKMAITLLSLRGAEMLKKEDLADFSPELQKLVFPDALEKNG
jgi:hypothetical protein